MASSVTPLPLQFLERPTLTNPCNRLGWFATCVHTIVIVASLAPAVPTMLPLWASGSVTFDDAPSILELARLPMQIFLGYVTNDLAFVSAGVAWERKMAGDTGGFLLHHVVRSEAVVSRKRTLL